MPFSTTRRSTTGLSQRSAEAVCSSRTSPASGPEFTMRLGLLGGLALPSFQLVEREKRTSFISIPGNTTISFGRLQMTSPTRSIIEYLQLPSPKGGSNRGDLGRSGGEQTSYACSPDPASAENSKGLQKRLQRVLQRSLS